VSKQVLWFYVGPKEYKEAVYQINKIHIYLTLQLLAPNYYVKGVGYYKPITLN
jgi:hypothetical protein